MSLEKKAIYAGFIGLAFTIIWSVFTYIVPSISEPNEDIFGIWLYDYGYSSGGGDLRINGTTEYFDNDSYNFTGIISLIIRNNNQKIEVTYNVDLSGEWIENDEKLVTKVVDIKSQPILVSVNSKELDLNILPPEIKRDFPKVEDFILLGTSEKYKIIELDEKKMELEAIAPKGNALTIIGTKQNIRFQRG